MAKKNFLKNITKPVLYLLLAVVGVVLTVKYLIPKAKELFNKKKPNPKEPLPAKKTSMHLHDEEIYKKMLKDNTKLARKWFINFYSNAQDSKLILDTDSQRQEFENWLKNELKEALGNQNYRKNLYEWLTGQVETPEASIVLNFLKKLQKDRKDFTREVLERLANEFNESFKGRPEFQALPSVLDTQIQTEPEKPKTVV